MLLLVGGGACKPPAQQTEAVLNAARSGNLEQVKALLKGNPDLVFSKDTNGWTPLFVAAYADRKDVAELLLASKAEVNRQGQDRAVRLCTAAANEGHKDMVELLLANKAEVNAKDNQRA